MPKTSHRRKIKDIAKSVLPEKNAPHVAGGVSVFVASALVLQLILFFLHFMIYETMVAAFGVSGAVPAVVLGVLSLTFISASLLAAIANNPVVRAYYRFSAVWFSFVAPLCGACAAFVIIENLFPYFGWVIAPFTAGSACFGVAIAVSVYGIWNSSHVRVVRITVPLPNSPGTWRGKRLVFFSDVHLGHVRAAGFARKIVKKVQALDPSVVAIGGDLFDGMKCDAEKLTAPFRDLRPPQGIYFVSGNHEYIRDREIFFAAIQAAGIKILRNEKVDADGIDLVGVDWYDADKREDFAAILKNIHLAKERPSILLRHVPDNLDIAERAGVSLQLSGHTHRGQFWPLSMITHYFYKGFDYGFRRFGKMFVYTTSGVGTWMSPFRFGTQSEIVVIEFE
jgi:predicted MPP superfamily phosphohydrolase